MAEQRWNEPESEPSKRQAMQAEQPSSSIGPEASGRAAVERLKAEIAAGTYRLSAEKLAAKLVRRIRWW